MPESLYPPSGISIRPTGALAAAVEAAIRSADHLPRDQAAGYLIDRWMPFTALALRPGEATAPGPPARP